MSHRPPHGTFDFLFAGPKQTRAMNRCNANYTRGYVNGRGQRDGRRSRR